MRPPDKGLVELLGAALLPVILWDGDVLRLFPVDAAVLHDPGNVLLKL